MVSRIFFKEAGQTEGKQSLGPEFPGLDYRKVLTTICEVRTCSFDMFLEASAWIGIAAERIACVQECRYPFLDIMILGERAIFRVIAKQNML